MAIIVNKEEKKREIALSCRKLFIEGNINQLTIATIAKTAKVGKGTIYEYFENKEDILFELVSILMYEHHQNKEKELAQIDNLRDKIKCFYAFYYAKESSDLRKLYKDFIAISLIAPNERVKAFQTECVDYYYTWVEALIDEAIAKGEIIEQSRMLVKGMFAFGQGMYIYHLSTNFVVDLEKEINSNVDTIFALIQKENHAS
jgi:AcrR family transcriptional regulator